MNNQTQTHGGNFFLGLLAILLMSALAAGVLVVIWKSVGAILSINSEIAKAIIVASITGGLSVGGLVYSKWVDRKRAIEETLRQKKSIVYEDFIKFWIDFFMTQKAGSDPRAADKLAKHFKESTHSMIVWGSDNVLKDYSTLKAHMIKAASEPTIDPRESMVGLEQLFFSIRRDLGHKNKNLVKADILQLFINDAKDHF